MTDGEGVVEACRAQRLVLPGGAVSWTVLGADHAVVGPAEEFLEFLRVQASSPNTVKSYARALALWWSYLQLFGLAWDGLSVAEVGGFLAWLRSGDGPQVSSIEPRPARFCEATIAGRLHAVMSFYRFHELNGVPLGGDLYRIAHGGSRYKPMLEHVARRRGRRRAVVRVRAAAAGRAAGADARGRSSKICDACAWFDPASRSWQGRVRDRLLWALLAESGLRLGEALGLQHRDWHTGRGDTPFVEVVPRDHPHGVRVKGGCYRRVFVSDELDRLYGEYLWQLCEAGADLAMRRTWIAAPVFVNLAGGSRGSRRGGRRACMTWWGGCGASWPGRSRRRGRRTGCGTRTPPALLLSRGAGARGVPPARPRRRADHAAAVRACHRGRRPAGGRAAGRRSPPGWRAAADDAALTGART